MGVRIPTADEVKALYETGACTMQEARKRLMKVAARRALDEAVTIDELKEIVSLLLENKV